MIDEFNGIGQPDVLKGGGGTGQGKVLKRKIQSPGWALARDLDARIPQLPFKETTESP